MYGKIIAEQEKRGFVEKVPTCVDGDVHYIPHHAVHKDSSTTPIGIVYDCNCHQSKHHLSLNDCLMVGPPQQIDICAIKLRFHCHAIGLSTDIENTFLHVRLNEADRDYTRFSWLSNPQDSEPVISFQICSIRVGNFSFYVECNIAPSSWLSSNHQ